MCQKSQKETLSFVLKPYVRFPWWRDIIHIIHSRLEAINKAAVVSKVHHLAKQKSGHTHKHGASRTFKIQIADSNRPKNTRGSERCEKDRTAISPVPYFDSVDYNDQQQVPWQTSSSCKKCTASSDDDEWSFDTDDMTSRIANINEKRERRYVFL